MPSYVHLVNPVVFRPEHPLSRAQAITVESMRVAREMASDLDIGFLSAQYPEDHAAVPPFFTRTPDLDRSVLDLKPFEKRRKLPLLADLLARGHASSRADFLIFTNIDIGLQPYFYTAIDQRVAQGERCFTINRRTIKDAPASPERLPELWAQSGKAHPGHDCFVFPRHWVPRLDLGAICTGVPWIGFILLANLACLESTTRVHEDLHLTFHLGDDQAWTQPADLAYREHNAREALAVLRRLEKRHGPFARSSGLGQHVLLAEQQVAAFDTLAARRAGDVRRPLTVVPGPRAPSRRPFIFSINSGRCGSEYLSALLGTAEGVHAEHEAEPTMSGPWLDLCRRAPLAASIEKRMLKADAIRHALAGLPPGTTWAETNHMFIKTFWDVALKAFDPTNIDVIILRRHLPSVLKSFMELGYFSDRNRVWPGWMHTPGSLLATLEPLGRDDASDPFDLAIGYLLDIEARAQAFAAQAPGCRVHEARLEGLQDMAGVGQLFAGLGLEPTEATAAMVGRRVNERRERKAEMGMGATLDVCEQRLAEHLARRRASGLALPDLPQLAAA